jgi:aryl-alcohol dehydrogenase-like predicted oxidoreductase
MSKDESRREFLERLTASAAVGAGMTVLGSTGAAAPAQTRTLPKRTLGRTGAQVSILAFGCGSRFLMYKDEDEALSVLNRAVDMGITYLDTAYSYGDGKSETRVGRFLATRRKDVWIATKIPDRTRDEFMRRLEASLKRLQVSQVDLCHIHSLGREEDLEKIEAPNGALKGLLEAREQKMTRFIGMTSHTDGAVLAQAIERIDLDCVQMALNPTQNGQFEQTALPAAKKKNLGIIAMKVMGQEFLLEPNAGKADPTLLLRYSMSLPVTAAVVGMPQLAFLDHNIQVARTFEPLSAEEMDGMRNSLGPLRNQMEKRLVGHLDGPTQTPQIFWA